MVSNQSERRWIGLGSQLDFNLQTSTTVNPSSRVSIHNLLPVSHPRSCLGSIHLCVCWFFSASTTVAGSSQRPVSACSIIYFSHPSHFSVILLTFPLLLLFRLSVFFAVALFFAIALLILLPLFSQRVVYFLLQISIHSPLSPLSSLLLPNHKT